MAIPESTLNRPPQFGHCTVPVAMKIPFRPFSELSEAGSRKGRNEKRASVRVLVEGPEKALKKTRKKRAIPRASMQRAALLENFSGSQQTTTSCKRCESKMSLASGEPKAIGNSLHRPTALVQEKCGYLLIVAQENTRRPVGRRKKLF